MAKVSVFRKATFNAAHRLYNPAWDEQTNNRVFGLCNNPNYHGHNYDLVVQVRGEVNPNTGYVVDMKMLKSLMHELVVDQFDHRNLNLDVEEFRTLNPTAENIAIVVWNRLRPHLPQELELTVRLYETERNFVEYAGE
jgi:6-pyruvoyltetrahydropterin/6-carboxytetrahydropterin synthase